MGPASAYSGCNAREDCSSSPRRRRCLLKGCEAWFRNSHPLARYCSDVCRRAARRWSQWRANYRYRHSSQGQECRRQQCQRRRERQRTQDNPPASEQPASCEREGYHQAAEQEVAPCHRPGCYECFVPTTRSPMQKVCSPRCRQALRCVLQRELRWQQRWRRLGISVYASTGLGQKPPDLSVAY